MIDMDDIVNNVYYGMVTRTDTPLIPGTWTYWNGDYRQEYNRQKAEERRLELAQKSAAEYIQSTSKKLAETLKEGLE